MNELEQKARDHWQAWWDEQVKNNRPLVGRELEDSMSRMLNAFASEVNADLLAENERRKDALEVVLRTLSGPVAFNQPSVVSGLISIVRRALGDNG